MSSRVRRWVWRCLMVAMHTSLLQLACMRGWQREIEVLFATEANLGMVRDSFLVNLLGPGILRWW